MIDLYFWTTGNGYKARIMIEEAGLPYNLRPIDIHAGEQLSPDYVKISPGHKIPAIVDPDRPDGNSVTLFESGPILQYLANKSESPLYPADSLQRLEIDQWLFFGIVSFAPISQQRVIFLHRFAEDLPAVKDHYGKLVRDFFATLDRRLADREYLAGDYSCSAPGSLDTSLSHAAGLIEIAACHA